ncbi:hypothetical protein M5K25_003278 [Dendrobium thyrsiflorum]|uniref:RING-type domain-containing protein n=1 Tax=Dendrobium thyrsiflorum TaxID=117978 RepID=A0ABD0VIW2_DENTH
MGQNCCVAARDKSLPNRISHEASTYRNVRQSPTWNFRWDNRTHIEDIMENHACYSHNNSGNVTSEVKSVADAETDGLSDSEIPCKAIQTFQGRKSFRSGGSDNAKFIVTDQSTASNSSPEANGSPKSSVLPNASDIKSSITIPYLSPPIKVEDPSSSTTSFTTSDPTSSRKSIRSHGFQLYRQISDSRIPSLKSLNEGSSSPEAGRLSFAFGNESSAIESHGVSSDGWSMRTFSELVASSQRERSSFETENLKIFGSNLQPKGNHTPNLQACGICLKLLKEKSPWSTQKIVSTNDLPIAAVLVCGHVYHAECLESLTSETDTYDPPCQVCSNNVERQVLKPPGAYELKGRNRVSRIAVFDADVDRDSNSDRRLRVGKVPFMGASSSMKSSFSKQFSGKGAFMGTSSSMKSSFSKPFLRRHLSTGSRPIRSASENDKTRKKWYWPRYLRESFTRT